MSFAPESPKANNWAKASEGTGKPWCRLRLPDSDWNLPKKNTADYKPPGQTPSESLTALIFKNEFNATLNAGRLCSPTSRITVRLSRVALLCQSGWICPKRSHKLRAETVPQWPTCQTTKTSCDFWRVFDDGPCFHDYFWAWPSIFSHLVETAESWTIFQNGHAQSCPISSEGRTSCSLSSSSLQPVSVPLKCLLPAAAGPITEASMSRDSSWVWLLTAKKQPPCPRKCVRQSLRYQQSLAHDGSFACGDASKTVQRKTSSGGRTLEFAGSPKKKSLRSTRTSKLLWPSDN